MLSPKELKTMVPPLNVSPIRRMWWAKRGGFVLMDDLVITCGRGWHVCKQHACSEQLLARSEWPSPRSFAAMRRSQHSGSCWAKKLRQRKVVTYECSLHRPSNFFHRWQAVRKNWKPQSQNSVEVFAVTWLCFWVVSLQNWRHWSAVLNNLCALGTLSVVIFRVKCVSCLCFVLWCLSRHESAIVALQTVVFITDHSLCQKFLSHCMCAEGSWVNCGTKHCKLLTGGKNLLFHFSWVVIGVCHNWFIVETVHQPAKISSTFCEFYCPTVHKGFRSGAF